MSHHKDPSHQHHHPADPGGDEHQHGMIYQTDPTVLWDFVRYALGLNYTDSTGISQNFLSNMLAVHNATSSYGGYSKGTEYWETTIWSTFTNTNNVMQNLTFSANPTNWSSTTQNPLASPYQSMGKCSVGWQAMGSAPSGNWLYAAAAGSVPAAAISLVSTSGVLSVSWAILAASKPTTGTYIVSTGGRYFDQTVPSTGSNTWWIPV